MTMFISLLAALLLFAAVITIFYLRQRTLAKKQPDAQVRPCGCEVTCSEHLYTISEPDTQKE